MASPVKIKTLEVARSCRHHGQDSPETATLRTELAALKIEEYVRQVCAAAPKMTAGQVDKITALLRTAAE